MRIVNYLLALVIVVSASLQLHNAHLFNPAYGLDAVGHIDYFEYLKSNRKIPPPHEGWEFHQTPLYYIDAMPAYVQGGVQAVQYQGAIYYLVYLLLAGYLVAKLFPSHKSARLIASLAIAALPVTNYLVPTISNEPLNSYLLSLSLVLMMLNPYHIAVVLLLVIGFYTKYTILTLGPAYLVALLLHKKRDWSRIAMFSVIFIVLTLPITWRNLSEYQRLLPLAYEFFPYQYESSPRDWAFFTNLEWLWKIDLFRAQNYSFLGGTWNTFWHDGHQITVPVTEFHKKALGLFLLGFPLSILSIMGWIQLRMRNSQVFMIGMTYLVTAVIAYVMYNLKIPYPSEVKAFFMSGLAMIYALGLTASYVYLEKSRKLISVLLVIQFALMVSYFWIQPWWHLAS